MKQLIYSLALIFIFSCTEKKDCIDSPDVSLKYKLKAERIEKEFFNIKNENELVSFFDKYSEFSNSFLERTKYPDSVLINNFKLLIDNEEIKDVVKDCEEVFNDFSNIENGFSESFSLLKHYYPNTREPKIYTFISGFKNDLAINDSLIAIGIDYFLGDSAKYRPNNPVYINRRYRPEGILPMSIMYISSKYNVSDMLNKTMLADMIFYGKSFYFAKQMLPCTPDSLIIGYTSIEFESTEDHAKRIWSYFVEEKLLYESSHFVKNKYVGERPKCVEIGTECPGRIGQWLGWKIVNAYMKNNPEVTLQELMAEKDANMLFKKSNYKPEL